MAIQTDRKPQRTAGAYSVASVSRITGAMPRMARPASDNQPIAQLAVGRKPPSDKREAIINAALELFVERGFHGTAVPEIAERAGVGAGTIYRYFESKEALVNQLYREHKAGFGQIAAENFPVTAPTREQFRVLWTRMRGFATEHKNAFVFLSLHHHAQYLDEQSRAIERGMTQLFTQIVFRAQERGDLKRCNPHLIMSLVMGAFIGLVRECIDGRWKADDSDWVLAEQCAWEAIRA